MTKQSTVIGPFRLSQAELPRRDGGMDIVYDILYTPRGDSDPTRGTLVTTGAPAEEALAQIRRIIMSAAEVHRMIRDREDPVTFICTACQERRHGDCKGCDCQHRALNR